MAVNTELPPNQAEFKSPKMNVPEERIIRLEERVDRIESDVGAIKIGIQTLLDRKQSSGISQIITTGASALAILAFILAFAYWHLTAAIAPIDTRLAEVQRRINDGEASMNRLTDSYSKSQIDIALIGQRIGSIEESLSGSRRVK